MKYMLLSIFVVCSILFTYRSFSRKPIDKIAHHLHNLHNICEDETMYIFNHQNAEIERYWTALCEKAMKHIDALRRLHPQLPDTAAIKKDLAFFITRWTFDSIQKSYARRDGKFASDINGLLESFPYKPGGKWKTLFPIFRA